MALDLDHCFRVPDRLLLAGTRKHDGSAVVSATFVSSRDTGGGGLPSLTTAASPLQLYMSQTSIIAGSLIIAFVVFITVRGQLSCYLEILGISTAGQCGSIAGSVAGGGGITLTGGGGGVQVQTPPIGVGPITVQPPVIRI